jgi:hypothetical protein
MVAVCATLIFVLALVSPVEMVDSDPALGLLAAQALVDHGTLSLNIYLDEPDLAYDLDADYRIRQWRGSYYYYDLGAPILVAPAVWVANRLGYHMLRQVDEFATQNLLSALTCAVVFVLLYQLCRHYLDPLPSLSIAAISTFGSSLMSTLATGLWNIRSVARSGPTRWHALEGGHRLVAMVELDAETLEIVRLIGSQREYRKPVTRNHLGTSAQLHRWLPRDS